MAEPFIQEAVDLSEQLKVFESVMNVIMNDINYLSNWNTGLQITLVVLSVLSTLFMALQDEINKKWMKPLGIITTTLSAGIISVYATFHIKENIILLSGIEKEIIASRNNLYVFLAKNPDKKNDLDEHQKYVKLINDLGSKRRDVWRLVGRTDNSSNSAQR